VILLAFVIALTEHTASSCVSAWTPDPITPAMWLSVFAKYLVASPLVAPVRRAVRYVPSTSTDGSPVESS
jgi:hypothetical protein